MANPLKKVFSNKPASQSITIHFETHEALNNFIRAANSIMCESSNGCIPVEGITSIDTYLGANGMRHPVEHEEIISDSIIFDPTKVKIFLVKTSSGPQRFIVFREEDKGNPYFQSDPSRSIILNFGPGKEPNTFHISYHVIRANAKSVSACCTDIETIYNFITNYIFKPEARIKELNILLKKIRSVYWYWRCLQEIESCFKVTFNLAEEANNEAFNVYNLYFLAIKRVPVRNMLSSFDFNIPEKAIQKDDLWNPEQLYGFCGQIDCKFAICDQTIKIKVARYIPSAYIRVEEKTGSKASYSVRCASGNDQPLVVIDKLFDEATDSEPEFNSMMMQLKPAKTISKLIEELERQDTIP